MMTIKSSFILLICIVFCVNTSRSQAGDGIDVVLRDRKSNAINFFRINSDQNVSVGENSGDWLKSVLGLKGDHSFTLLSSEEDKLSMVHYRYRQTYSGYPVENTMYILHTRGGRIVSGNGEYVIEPSEEIQTSKTEEFALQKAIEYINADTYKWEVESEELELKNASDDPNATYYPRGELVFNHRRDEDGYVLCYKFDVYAHLPLSRNFVYVNANTGAIVNSQSRIHYVDSLGLGDSRYSSRIGITANYNGGVFKLEESGRGQGILTRDMKNGTNYSSAVAFVHPDNLWDSLGINGDLAIDAHFAAEATYDYLYKVHGRNSIDGNGMALYSYVHFDKDFTNAFWDGQRMTYGDGDSSIGALVSIDICSHEIGHGLQQFTSQFSSNGETSALAESFSDILGLLVENYKFPGRSDSLIYNAGDQVMNNNTGMRNYLDPTLTSNPNTYKGQNWDNSNFNSHGNGVVHSHWFYILAEGLSGINDNNDAFNVSGIGKNKAADIAYRNLSVYLTPNSDFDDARIYSIESARDLFGSCSNEEIQTTNAWYAVGVGDQYTGTLKAAFEFSVDFCTDPVEVAFKNNSLAAVSYHWDFGDGTTGTASNPTHSYPVDGTYTIKLLATGCDMISQDSAVNQNAIEINNQLECDSATIPLSGNLSTANCYGFMFDHGGKSGDVVPNTNGSFTIEPPNAIQISIQFLSFEYFGFTDRVTIYDGKDISSPILYVLDVFHMPNDTVFVSTGGVVTFQENTGPSFPGFPNGTGFEAKWSCVEKPASGLQNESSSVDLRLYPNPVTERLFIENRSHSPISRIEVVNIYGETVYRKNLTKAQPGSTTEISTDFCTSAGMYLIRVYRGETISVDKFLVNGMN